MGHKQNSESILGSYENISEHRLREQVLWTDMESFPFSFKSEMESNGGYQEKDSP
jgi:hypothetical protein